MMTEKDFAKYVRDFRAQMPTYNYGRAVKVLSEYTAAGKRILDMASHWDGDNLRQVYDKPSAEKMRIFDECYEMYRNDTDSEAFAICSHNTFNFTVSWVCPGKVVFLTSVNEYIVLCNE